MSEKYEKLKAKLRELFQLDQPDLDFGFYRVMHAKSVEVAQFLDNDLLPQVKEAFGLYKTADKAELEKDLAKAIEQAQSLGADPETLPKVKELRAKLKSDAVDVGALENEIYDHLFSFFRRYYSEGDFLAMRVYKPGVYAIPYQGEEVMLHWANKDQYYIKTSEYLRDYAFRLRPEYEKKPMRVHFRLSDAAEGEHGNVKAAAGKDRVFILAPGESRRDFIAEEGGELSILFEYRSATLTDWPEDAREGKIKPPAQKDLIALATQRVLTVNDPKLSAWIVELGKPHVTTNGEKKEYTRIEAHLGRYTTRNTFDYFIHKDLGGFLRRELDFYIKNEVMHLDDVENESGPKVEQYLSKIKVIRKIAGKIIAFLAQLEDFQKKLWLKKKFVVETNYCITLDRIPEAFYQEIAANVAQREEWVRLFAIDQNKSDKSGEEAYSQSLTPAFLKTNNNLVVDTALFDSEFKVRLISAFDDIGSEVDGVLIHSDNFQALNLIQRSFHQEIKCAYIDPPYNTESSAILYKNNYRHSSWCTMIRDRVSVARRLLQDDGALFVSIDKAERTVLEHALDEVFGAENHIEELIWTQATANSQLPNYSTNHEYVEVYARDRRSVERDAEMFREPKPGYREVMELIQRLQPDYPDVMSISQQIKKLFKAHLASYKEELEASGREWDDEAKRQDPWRGLYLYSNAEYRDSTGALVPDAKAKAAKASIWVWRAISAGAPASKQSPTTKDPKHFNYRFYRPLHPVTGRPCPHPRGGWKFPVEPDPNNAARRSFVEFERDNRIAWGEDETTLPGTKGFLHEVETNIGTSVFYEYNDGENELTELFGESGLFLSPKSSRFVRKFIRQAAGKRDWFIDFFGGSGSSGHAVITQNREDGGERKQILIEVGRHFDTILIPRIKKVAYSSSWRGGKPTVRAGGNQMFKYCRLESYEDALNNLDLRRTHQQQSLLDVAEAQGTDGLKEQYLLRYMLDVETRGSQSLLNVEAFKDPTAYKLKVKRPGSDESREMNVDLLETFDWLIGLTVRHIAAPQSFTAEFERDSEKRLQIKKGRLKGNAHGPWWFRTVTGTMPDGRRTLIIWRKLTGEPEQDNLVLDEWFTKQGYSTKDFEFQLVYVNGDNNLENLKAPDDTWKVRLIEEDFHRLMFDTEGV